MLSQRRSFRLFLAVVATSVASSVAVACPQPYRYTGVVAPIAGVASHAITVGDGFKFYFEDKNSVRAPAYTLCVYRKRASAPLQCWDRPSSRYYFDRFKVGNLDNSPVGALVAKWIVGGRVVTKWPFYVAKGD